ncbi:unnamed protein product [Owenia fusiformis]|uniref:Uncharacterized protein n=1 Tax=Owenia fusiformis TaxID=6347 RepID=A0A8J1TRW5_OWEFU|nr:unnamed protein product [Owenia fusiformis]
MGNKQSCSCFTGSPRTTNRSKKYAYETSYQPQDIAENSTPRQKTTSSSNLQHISEREPDEGDDDPSNHPTANTIFLTRSKSEIQRNTKEKLRRRSQYDNHGHHHRHHHDHDYHHEPEGVKKYSSCSTIYIDNSTVSQPNLKNTIKAVALAIYFHIRNRDVENLELRLLDIFDEKLHPLSKDPVPRDYDVRDPDHKTIYRFIRTLFNAAQLTAECAIVTLVYLERLLTYAEIEIAPSNWKRIVLGAILLGSKVWDDQAVWNVDYCQILKDITVDDMNELERQFLEMLQFNINVPSSVYAKYYFDLRALADEHDLGFPLEALSKDRALKLEAMSNNYEDKLKDVTHGVLKRSQSLDGLTTLPKGSKAILS